MNASPRTDSSARFDELVAEHGTYPGVSRSTMMGYPCLRLHGDFYAALNPNDGALIIKLPAPDIEQLLVSGIGEEFAPNGRRFREWAAIRADRHPEWAQLAERAHKAARQRIGAPTRPSAQRARRT